MTLTESLRNRYNKHPESSINGNTSLDDEFISLIENDSELGGLIKKDIDNSGDRSSIYQKIISKLSLLEFSDIKTLLSDYVSSNFWISLGSDKQLKFIERTLKSCEEQEQKALESIGVVKTAQGKPKKIKVPFDVVADKIRDRLHIFTMRDNKQLYIYKDGVYRSEGAEAILDTEIRNIHNEIYRDSWDSINPNISIGHIPKATVRYVNEVLAHIRAYTHITRDSLEKVQSKYINFKNCLFNLETWKTEDHSPEMKSICQISVTFDKDSKCPKISDFLESVVAEPDINLLCEMAGYCLTMDCSQQKAFMLYGVGSNGKSVFLALLESLVGGNNISSESLQRLEFDKYRTAKLYGKLVNICGDIPDIKMNKSEIFKKLTSGLDWIDAENKYQDPFKFHNTAKLVFSANNIPEGKKDKAYYRRWVLIEFPNNFEGKNADKSLITKLQTPEELSGFLNLALDGLKRLKENEKFSNEKSIEATQKEYELNSNPIAVFMNDRTQISDEDCDATILYLEYVDWCNSYRKDHISNIGFSRKLKSLGYDSHRENVQDGNSTQKIIKWDNLKIEKDKIGQVRTGYEYVKNISCPSSIDIEKTEIGQDVNPFVTNYDSFSIPIYQNISNVIGCGNGGKHVNSEISLTRKDLSCPNMRFFDTNSHLTGYTANIESHLVQEQKVTNSERFNEENFIKKDEYIKSFRTDLKKLVRSNYNDVVESIPDLLNDFNRRYPGYKQVFETQELQNKAEKLYSWGWT